MKHLIPVDDPKQLKKPNISRAKALLDWTPKVDLKNGRDNTPYVRERLREDVAA